MTLDPIRETDVSNNGDSYSRAKTQGMDKLSTPEGKTVETQDTRSPVNRSAAVRNPSELMYQDADGNVLPIADIELKTLLIICEAVIEKTHIDYYIFRRAYDSREILIHWNDEYIKVSDSSCGKVKGKVVVMEWNAAKHMFRIVVNGKDYIMLHKTLEQVLRRYIREQYTLDRIQSVIKEKH